jgi:hypothetical protein
MTSISNFISIEGVSKKFGSIVAVDNVNIEISAGEFCWDLLVVARLHCYECWLGSSHLVQV